MKIFLQFLAVAGLCFLGAGCADERARDAEVPPADSGAAAQREARPVPVDSFQATLPPDTTAPAFEWTAGIVERPGTGPGVALLQDVRTARHEAFDRVVFGFGGEVLPGYHLEYVDRPVRRCGSGEVVPMAGDGWLEVRLTPAQAHTDAGEVTVADRSQRPGLPVLKQLELTCDFEGNVTWVLGLAAPNRYRVLELQAPARLVVDVRH